MCEKVYLDEMSKDEIVREAYLLYTLKENLIKVMDKWNKLYCESCKHRFKVKKEFKGIITCPYCGDYVDG